MIKYEIPMAQIALPIKHEDIVPFLSKYLEIAISNLKEGCDVLVEAQRAMSAGDKSERCLASFQDMKEKAAYANEIAENTSQLYIAYLQSSLETAQNKHQQFSLNETESIEEEPDLSANPELPDLEGAKKD